MLTWLRCVEAVLCITEIFEASTVSLRCMLDLESIASVGSWRRCILQALADYCPPPSSGSQMPVNIVIRISPDAGFIRIVGLCVGCTHVESGH